MDDTVTVPSTKWEFALFFKFPHPASPVALDVLESYERDEEMYRRPLRVLADSIIHGIPLEEIQQQMTEEDLITEINDIVNKGLRLMHYAAFQNNIEVASYLLQSGADPNTMDVVGYSPVHICAEKGYTELLILLIEHGARIRFTEIFRDDHEYGDPPRATQADEPLRLAIKNRHHLTARVLLEYGANPSTKYFLGQEINLCDPMDLRSLELLLTFGADPNALDLEGITPLMKACRNPGAVEAVHLLISYGADVNAVTHEDQKTPLHYAIIGGNLEVVQILVHNGAKVDFPLLLYSRPPLTPLFFAVLRGNVEILKFLLRSGASVNINSNAVGSALHIALTEKIDNQMAVVTTLLENGANPNAITLTMDRKPLLKTPIGEYLQNCEHPNPDIIRLLLKYGARIVMKGQSDSELGILKVVHRIHLGLHPEVMNLLIEASEGFNVSFIEKSKQLSDDHKELLLSRALQPFSLKQIARIQLRKSIGWGPNLLTTVERLDLPIVLQRYVLFEE